MGKRQDNLLAKIAALTGKSFEEIKEVATPPLLSHEESVYEAQAVLNFFYARVQPTQRAKETDKQFEARYHEWRFKTCKECNLEFAYAYTYEGVAYCSLDCLDASLRKVGLQVTRGRDLRKRWGQYVPAVVSASALATMRSAYSDSEGVYDVPFQKALPKPQPELYQQEDSA